MSRPCPWLVAALLAAVLAIAPGPARPDDFYRGKTITITVGGSPGGGYSTYARAVARFLPDHIPGHPAVVVQSMPGAGNLIPIRALNVTASKDGTVMAELNSGVLIQSVVQPEKVNVDFSKFAWIGIGTPIYFVCYGFGTNGVSSFDDLMHRRQFIVGSTGKASLSYSESAALRDVFGAPVKIVVGYPGSAEVRIALERGELDGDCGDFSSIPANWVRDGKARLFVRFNRDRPPEIPENARFVEEFAATQDQRDLLGVLVAANELGRTFLMSGEVSANLTAIMRKAFDDTMNDPGFLAEAAKQQLPVRPRTGEETAQIVKRIMNISPAVAAKVKRIFYD
jgi:tripartite-type tricarboxylate transporter receptor subunit TctC